MGTLMMGINPLTEAIHSCTGQLASNLNFTYTMRKLELTFLDNLRMDDKESKLLTNYF